MQTDLADWIKDTPDGREAGAILRTCVHCGFCNATCPTYQLLGDELDGPRGRIYLIKQVLEGVAPTASTQLHLDRCLTCRNCETTCPSGVQYGRLLDIGRHAVDQQVERPLGERVKRGLLRDGLTSVAFAPALKLGQSVRGLLPQVLRNKVPAAQDAGSWPQRSHARRMILLEGCVQPAMRPNINTATARVLDALGIELLRAPQAGCCGAIRHHLDDPDGALDDIRRNVDAWWPLVQAGAEAVLGNASACGAMVKDYGHLLRNDPAYAARAARVSALARDVVEVMPEFAGALRGLVAGDVTAPRVVFHPPCTLQHGQKIRGAVEALLRMCGAELLPFGESHLCCGSAGTYSVLQPKLSFALRDRKLANLQSPAPAAILSANIGCITHLQGGTDTPVMHWIEWLDRRIQGTGTAGPAEDRPGAAKGTA
jgi:glycolate oxidase iron-sulfur subunit